MPRVLRGMSMPRSPLEVPGKSDQVRELWPNARDLGVAPNTPAATAMPVQTASLRIATSQQQGWDRIEAINDYRVRRGMKFRMRIVVTVCDSEKRCYVGWPQATSTVECGDIEGGKDVVWALDELIEAIGRVGPAKAAQALRALEAGA